MPAGKRDGVGRVALRKIVDRFPFVRLDAGDAELPVLKLTAEALQRPGAGDPAEPSENVGEENALQIQLQFRSATRRVGREIEQDLPSARRAWRHAAAAAADDADRERG